MAQLGLAQKKYMFLAQLGSSQVGTLVVLNPIHPGLQKSLFTPRGGKITSPDIFGPRSPNLVQFSRNLQQMFTMVSCLDYNFLWACTCTHACTAHKIVHAPFPPTLIISRIRHFKKMAVTSLKCVETAWLSQSGKCFGWFWGGLFSSLFSFGAVFLQKIGFFDFQNFQNCQLIIFRGPGGALLKKNIFFFCFGHEPKTI